MPANATVTASPFLSSALMMSLLLVGCGQDDQSRTRPNPLGANAVALQGLTPHDAPPAHISHLAIGATINASSTHRGGPDELGVEALIDGDPTTAWSSAYADDQEILIDLHAVKAIGQIRLLWGDATATSFDIQVSQDGSRWSVPIRTLHDAQGRHEDDMPINAAARYVRIALRKRATPVGFTLYEIAVEPPH